MNTNKDKYLIIIAGPTAVGKTKSSIKLAKKYKAEIFSCDSRQLYKEMNIGTAKPSEEELSAATHHFINKLSVTESYTAGDYERDMDIALAGYFKDHKVAIMTGGTGLYINAVTKGLDQFPAVPKEVAKDLNNRLESKNGLVGLLTQLKSLDPTTYNAIDQQNSRRIVRALGVCLAEGQPYSSYLKKDDKALDYTPLYFALTTERQKLYNRINQRVDLMMDAGLLQEVESLYEHRNLPALNTVGYSELFRYMDGDISLREAVELIKRNSRRYAKRQMTWFRNQGVYWFVTV